MKKKFALEVIDKEDNIGTRGHLEFGGYLLILKGFLLCFIGKKIQLYRLKNAQ